MKVIVSSAMRAKEMKETLLEFDKIKLTFESQKGIQMIFNCEEADKEETVSIIKSYLKSLPEFGGIFFNVSAK